MTYVSIARGFKSGGFNVRGDEGLPNMGFTPFGPESAITYELGVKSEWLQHHLRLNATLFDTEYRDIQLRQQTIVDGMVTTLIENAARARIKRSRVRAQGGSAAATDRESGVRLSATEIPRCGHGSRAHAR